MKDVRENLPAPERRENAWVWAALVAILVLYVFSALRAKPTATFGVFVDDALYFSSAKALATGQGYVLPSFPVRLRATKYPELYPLLLAGIWKIDPHFPSNVKAAVALTLVFGCGGLCFAFLLLRRWPGMGDWQALAVVGLCAFTGNFLILSASTLTDVPFMAMMLGAIWLADCQDWRSSGAFGAGFLAGLSVGLRSLGVAAIAGIGLVLLVKRDFRRLLWFSLAALPLTLLSVWPALTAMLQAAGSRPVLGLAGSGWMQTLCYYSSYACNWRMGVTTPRALEVVVLTNLKSVIQEPGLYLLTPLATKDRLWSLVLVSLVGIAAYAGIIRYLRKAGWQPLLVAFAFYLLVIVPWPYTPQRFLVAFLPLLIGGLWLEGRRLVSLIAEHLRPIHSTAERTIAVVLAAGGLALVSTVAVNYGYAIPAQVGAQASTNQSLLADQLGAYAWIRQNTRLEDRVIAYEDGLLFLHTGRPAVVQIVCLPQSFYENDRRFAEHDAAHLADVARHIDAAYWLTTIRDFSLNGDMDYAILQKRQELLLASAPLVYHSADGAVKIFDVRSLFHTDGNVQSSAPVTERKNGTRPRHTR